MYNFKPLFQKFEPKIKEIDMNNINNIKEIQFDSNISIDPISLNGNCLFESLSYMIFNDIKYHKKIRHLICNYYETHINSNDLFVNIKDKKNYINNLKKDKVYGTISEIKIFSLIFKIKIILLKTEENIKIEIFGKENEGNFMIRLMKNNEDGKDNYFVSCNTKNNNKGISENKLNEIKNRINNIKIQDEKKEIKINKEIIPTKIKPNPKHDNKNNFSNDYYNVTNKLENPEKFNKLLKYVKLSDIIQEINSGNKNEIINTINKHKNILIDKVKINNKEIVIDTKNYKKI